MPRAKLRKMFLELCLLLTCFNGCMLRLANQFYMDVNLFTECNSKTPTISWNPFRLHGKTLAWFAPPGDTKNFNYRNGGTELSNLPEKR